MWGYTPCSLPAQSFTMYMLVHLHAIVQWSEHLQLQQETLGSIPSCCSGILSRLLLLMRQWYCSTIWLLSTQTWMGDLPSTQTWMIWRPPSVLGSAWTMYMYCNINVHVVVPVPYCRKDSRRNSHKFHGLISHPWKFSNAILTYYD